MKAELVGASVVVLSWKRYIAVYPVFGTGVGRGGGGGYQILSENKVGYEWDIRFLKYHILIISSYQFCFQRLYMNTLFLDQKKTISFDSYLISIYLISVRRYPEEKTQGYQFAGVCVYNSCHLTYIFETSVSYGTCMSTRPFTSPLTACYYIKYTSCYYTQARSCKLSDILLVG